MPDSVRANESDTHRSEDWCAGVRGCAADLPARGVRVCGCVYTAHHTPVPHTTEDTPRCAESKTRTPAGEPEPVGPIAERVLDDLAARQREALRRLARQTPAIHTTRESHR